MSLTTQFWKFAPAVTIPSRDEGLVKFRPWGTQRHLCEQLITGVSEGIHDFIVLKPRQVGATTALLVFDAFWLLKHDGLQGAFIIDSDENKLYMADVLKEVVKTIPARWSYPIRVSNRVQTSWMNGSRLVYAAAGQRGNKRLGRSRGLAFLHASEVAFWGDPGGVAALRGSLSERHPSACYVWESTANGYNFFYDMWQDAQRAVTRRPIFVPWWRHELYALDPASKAYRVYWDGALTGEERAWQREIDRRWGVTLTPAQWAWYRWKLAEKIGDPIMMHQEFPTLPEHAFQASGMGFVGAVTMARLRQDLSTAPAARWFRYTFGPLIEQTDLVETSEQLGHLTVWEEPEDGHHYVVAADPAFGASADSDRSVCGVWRAERTRLIQVAEFVSNEVTLQQFAWVCAHLCGAYMRSYYILELSGPGMAVWQEHQRLQAWGWGTARRPELQEALAGIQHYIYRRPDSMAGSAAWQWKTTPESKTWIMSRFRDQLITGTLTVRSAPLVEELGNVRQVGDQYKTTGHAHDDRVIAGALAVEAWAEQVMPMLQMLPMVEAGGPPREAPPAHERVIQEFFRRLQVPEGGRR